jgi:hypothetical protein
MRGPEPDKDRVSGTVNNLNNAAKPIPLSHMAVQRCEAHWRHYFYCEETRCDLVLSGSLNAINDEYAYRYLFGFQAKAELVWQCLKD